MHDRTWEGLSWVTGPGASFAVSVHRSIPNVHSGERVACIMTTIFVCLLVFAYHHRATVFKCLRDSNDSDTPASNTKDGASCTPKGVPPGTGIQSGSLSHIFPSQWDDPKSVKWPFLAESPICISSSLRYWRNQPMIYPCGLPPITL